MRLDWHTRSFVHEVKPRPPMAMFILEVQSHDKVSVSAAMRRKPAEEDVPFSWTHL